MSHSCISLLLDALQLYNTVISRRILTVQAHISYMRLTPAYRLSTELVFTHSIYVTSPSYSFYGKRLTGKRLSGKVLIRETSVNPSNWLHGDSARNNWSANNTVKQSTDHIRSVFVTMLMTVQLCCWNLDLLSQTHTQYELLNPVYTTQPVLNALCNRFDNRLYRVNKHPTGGWMFLYTIQPVVKPVVKRVWQPVWQPCWTNSGCSFNRLSNRVVQPVWQPPVYVIQPFCQTGCQTGLTTGWLFVYTIQPVVKPVSQRVWQSVVSCIQTFTQLSNRFDNRFDNRLYRVKSAADANTSRLHVLEQFSCFDTLQRINDLTNVEVTQSYQQLCYSTGYFLWV